LRRSWNTNTSKVAGRHHSRDVYDRGRVGEGVQSWWCLNSLLIEGTEAREVGTYVVSEFTDESLISDQLVSEFGIVVEDPARGLWRLKGESVIRSSER
jgi:hypothetical protein